MSSCVVLLSNFKKKNKLSININGDCQTVSSYVLQAARIIVIMSLVLLKYLLMSIPYYQVTVIGSTIYSYVLVYYLRKHNIRFVHVKSLSNMNIPFTNPSWELFGKIHCPIIPLLEEDLLILSNHTGIDYKILQQVQHYLTTTSNEHKMKSLKLQDLPIMTRFTKVTNDLYYVSTEHNSWFSKIIVTDEILPLSCSEIISELDIFVEQTCETNQLHITQTKKLCTIQQDNIRTTLKYISRYYINNLLELITINPEDEKHSEFYVLEKCRKFIRKDGILMVHPFHLPRSWDPFFLIILVVLSKLI